MDLFAPALNRLLDEWLDEDLGRGDLTSAALRGRQGCAYWITKQQGVFCGGELVERIFSRLDPSVQIKLLVADGSRISIGQKLLELEGPAASLAAGERTALNLSMRLSGIATATAALVAELEGTHARLVDTRKTTPGLRLLEKYATRCGGGQNHRLGLDDAAMLKENHLAWCDGVKSALRVVRDSSPWPTRIIVEAETSPQATEAVIAGADGILLDEFSPEELHVLIPRLRQIASESVSRGGGQIIIEASGVETKFLKAYAEAGVDLISTSAPITRSSWLDFSMRFQALGS